MQALAIHAFCELCIATYVLSARSRSSRCWPARLGARGPASGARPQRRTAGARRRGCSARSRSSAFVVAAENDARLPRAARRQAHAARRARGRRRRSHGPLRPRAPGPRSRPASPPPLRPAAPPAGPQDASYWQERAQKLQETIDDPRKLDAYFAAEGPARVRHGRRRWRSTSRARRLAGPANAPVKVVEFSDFMCPFCRNLAVALAQFVPQAGGRVVVYFKNYPLDKTCNAKLPGSTHPGACNLALGAVCAQSQGKFEAYHDRVFSTELHNPTAGGRRPPRRRGRASTRRRCRAASTTRRRRRRSRRRSPRATGSAVNATPTLYINGKKLPRINDFVAVVDKEARKKGFAPLGPAE